MDRICQIKIKRSLSLVMFALGFFACSAPKVAQQNWSQEASAVWFEDSDLMGMRDMNGLPLAHGFFDLDSEINRESPNIRFVLLTPKKSKFGHQLELSSGRKYRKQIYCERKDIWKSYKKDLNTPPYTDGLIPRLLDSEGRPQKIIVFGDLKYFEPLSLKPQTPPFAQRVRVVGGFIQHYCMEEQCNNNWQKKVILIAVNPKDPKFELVNDLKNLKDVLGWEWGLTQAFLANGDGQHMTIHGASPAFRLGSFSLSGPQAIQKALQDGHQFHDDELKSLKNNCHKLYDYIWEHVSKIKKQRDIEVDKFSEWEKHQKEKQKSWVAYKKENESEFLLDYKNPYGSQFDRFFFDFYRKYGKRYMTCSHYVRAGNIQNNIERFWFFTQFNLFYKLLEMDYVYLCNKNKWVKNSMKNNRRPTYDQLKQLKTCNSENLDRAFKEALAEMEKNLSIHRPHYHFVEYDTGLTGSHEKIYAWVYEDGLRYSCEDEKDKKFISERQHSNIIPPNTPWMLFSTPLEQEKRIK